MNKKAVYLIDDDELVRLTWNLSAKRKDIPFKSFQSMDDFLSDVKSISHDCIIYIDSLLDDKKGEEEALKLYNLGYRDLRLCTGLEKDNFDLINYPWLKSVEGKSPPF